MKFLKKYGVVLIVLVVLVSAYFADISLIEIADTFKKLSVYEITIILVCSLSIMAADAIMRIYLLKRLGYKLSVKSVLLIHFSAISAHYATPVKIGFPVLAVLLKRVCNVKYADTTIMITIGLVASLGLAGVISFIGSLFYYSDNIITVSIALLGGVILCGFVLFLLKKMRIRFPKIQSILTDLQAGIAKFKVIHLSIYMLMRIGSVLLYGLLFSFMVKFMGSDISVWQSTVATSSSYFLGAVSMVPMGIGVSEATLGFYLNSFGVEDVVIVSVLILQRVFSTVLGFATGIISSLILGAKSLLNAEGE